MPKNQVAIALQNVPHKYSVEISTGILNDSGEWAKNCLSSETNKTLVISNKKVFALYGEQVVDSLSKAGFEAHVFLMKDGEKHKNLKTVEQILKFASENKFTRTDSFAALGGGVVGDVAGFAAGVFLRGIEFLQIPTTLLAMIDSSVGGKTGVNSEFGKNLIGVFHQPNGVLIDIETLKTLPKRELIAGFCEVVKQSAIADRNLFDRTADFLQTYSPKKFKRYFAQKEFLAATENLIAAQIAFKAAIVMQDERENVARTDAKSRKILNFGHTLAHALEKITDYKRFKHGEAVGYGILFAAALSKKLDIFDKSELKLLNDVLRGVGDLPDARNINLQNVFEAFAFDKKLIGNSLQLILLEEIGKPKIVANANIPTAIIRETLEEILGKRRHSEDSS